MLRSYCQACDIKDECFAAGYCVREKIMRKMGTDFGGDAGQLSEIAELSEFADDVMPDVLYNPLEQFNDFEDE